MKTIFTLPLTLALTLLLSTNVFANIETNKKIVLDFYDLTFNKHKPTEASAEVKRVIAEGDLVVLHVLSKQNKKDRGEAVVDIFRVENGKIVEHWDVIQAVPEKTVSGNPML